VRGGEGRGGRARNNEKGMEWEMIRQRVDREKVEV